LKDEHNQLNEHADALAHANADEPKYDQPDADDAESADELDGYGTTAECSIPAAEFQPTRHPEP
jgi:hypothetical protein